MYLSFSKLQYTSNKTYITIGNSNNNAIHSNKAHMSCLQLRKKTKLIALIKWCVLSKNCRKSRFFRPEIVSGRWILIRWNYFAPSPRFSPVLDEVNQFRSFYSRRHVKIFLSINAAPKCLLSPTFLGLVADVGGKRLNHKRMSRVIVTILWSFVPSWLNVRAQVPSNWAPRQIQPR